MAFNAELRKLEHDAIVTLFELDTRPIGGSTVLRFTGMPHEDGTNVFFGGQEFFPIDVEATGFKWDGKGAFPRPTIRISNVGGFVSSALTQIGDIVGSKFTRLRTFAQFLDGSPTADPTATFPPEIYTINKLNTRNKIYLEWQLTSVFDQLGVKLPRRQIIRDVCTHTYRTFDETTQSFVYENVTCPYTGNRYYDEFGDEVIEEAADVCSKDLTGCRLRFGEFGNLPTRQFPGISKIRGR